MNTCDGIFFINNALKVKTLSVYSTQERFEQTLETLQSIDKHCPNNMKYIFDSSAEEPEAEHIEELRKRGVNFVYTGGIPDVKNYSAIGSYGSRSVAETIAFIYFLNWFLSQNISAKRIYKISGRYRLNDNFIVNDDRYEDAFVFAKPIDSWMPKEKQEATGVDKLYLLRCWHMDFSLLDSFSLQLPKILQDCATYSIDVEHSYYKNLHTYKTIELDKIGVCGNIAPSGDYIDE